MEERIHFVLTAEERSILERLAAQERRTKSNLLRKWIADHAKELIDEQ